MLCRHFIVRYEIFALLKLKYHLRPSLQGVNDINTWAHHIFSMLQSLLEGSNIQDFRIVFHKPTCAKDVYYSKTSSNALAPSTATCEVESSQK